MAGLFDTVSKFARSPQGRKLADSAKRAAGDPKNRAKIDQLRGRLGRKGGAGGGTPAA